MRISKGVYLKARRTRFGVSYPPIEEIVSQIAKRDKARDLNIGGRTVDRVVDNKKGHHFTGVKQCPGVNK